MFENTMKTKVPFWDKVYMSKVPFVWLAPCPYSKLWEILTVAQYVLQKGLADFTRKLMLIT